MKNPFVVLFACILLLSGTLILNGCEKETGHRPGEEKEAADNSGILDTTVIRTAGTDVAALDSNKDGMLYQCPMHFAVISDGFGRCPECKMDLETYTVQQTADNFNKE
jgi:hypothetical protein